MGGWEGGGMTWGHDLPRYPDRGGGHDRRGTCPDYRVRRSLLLNCLMYFGVQIMKQVMLYNVWENASSTHRQLEFFTD